MFENNQKAGDPVIASDKIITYDASKLTCPYVIAQLRHYLKSLQPGTKFYYLVSDPSFGIDLKVFLSKNPSIVHLVNTEEFQIESLNNSIKQIIRYYLIKGEEGED